MKPIERKNEFMEKESLSRLASCIITLLSILAILLQLLITISAI